MEQIIQCPLCKIGNQECDCDKCGVWGCYECVSGGWGKDKDLNLCVGCEDDEEEDDEEEDDKKDEEN